MKNCRLKIDIAGESDTGLSRRSNEDDFLVCRRETAVIAAVSDGIGGNSGGEIASGICSKTILYEAMRQNDFSDAVSFLSDTINQVNTRIFERNLRERRLSPMGCTVVAAVFTADKITVASTGDSRFYECLPGEKPVLKQITADHHLDESTARKLAEKVGKDTDYLIKRIITRSIGTKIRPTIDFYTLTPDPEAVYLLCSDGLSNFVPAAEIAGLLQTPGSSARRLTSALMRQSLISNGSDNITIITVRYPQDMEKN